MIANKCNFVLQFGFIPTSGAFESLKIILCILTKAQLGQDLYFKISEITGITAGEKQECFSRQNHQQKCKITQNS